MHDSGSSATVVVVDDEEVTRFTLSKKLSKFGYNVVSLDRAEDVLYMLKENRKIDFIITDVKLRKMDGIELLRHITLLDNTVPVLLLSGEGTIDDAIRALRFGACDFIRKPFDAAEVASVVRSVLKRKNEEKLTADIGQFVAYEKRTFSLPSDSNLGNVISYKLTQHLPGIGLCNQITAENMSLAVREAISNAMFHGNLELTSNLREEQGVTAFHEEVERRLRDVSFSRRRVSVDYELTPEYVEYIIEDEGNGFDFTKLPDPRDPENFFKKSGRGILIIKIHMDEVEWNAKGNRLRMRKYRIKNTKGES